MGRQGETYGKPFQAAIQEGLKGIMPCYCSINGEPVSVSEELLTKLLREDMGFDGLCISDYGGVGNSHTVQHIGETMAEAGQMALKAGMDIEMPSPAGYGDGLWTLFENGQSDIRLLDRAVLRILTAKFRMGLFEHPFAMEGEPLRAIFSNGGKAGQIPVYYNHPWGSCNHQGESIGFTNYVDLPHTPRYPFGFGLSYTEFLYDRLRLSSREIALGEPLEVSVEIRNVGDAAGDEVVQLYLSDRYASRTRPVQELAGFKRLHLEPGEAKTVAFTVDFSQMAFLDKDMHWKIEKGEFEVRVGASSLDIRASDTVRLSEDAWINGRDRKMCAIAEVRA